GVVGPPAVLAAAAPPPAPGPPADVPTDRPEPPRGLFRWAWGGVKAGLAVVATACNGAGTYVANKAAAVMSLARSGWRLLSRFRGRLLIACGVGLAAGALTYPAGP